MRYFAIKYCRQLILDWTKRAKSLVNKLSTIRCYRTVECFQLLLCNTIGLIQHQSFVCTQLNGYTGWNDRIVAQEKTWFHFRLMKTGFLFCCRPSTSWTVVYKSQEGQEPSIMSESDTMFNERDRKCTAVQLMLSTDPSYDNRTIARTSKCTSGLPRITGTCPVWWKQSFWLRLWSLCGFKWGPYHATSYLPSQIESQHQSLPGCAEECGDPLVQSSGLRETLGVAAGLGAGPQVQRDLGLASEGVLRLCTLLSLPPSYSDLNPLDYFVWSYVENINNMTSHDTKPVWSPPSTEYSLNSHRRLSKRHAPSSGSVSKRWLRLKAAT